MTLSVWCTLSWYDPLKRYAHYSLILVNRKINESQTFQFCDDIAYFPLGGFQHCTRIGAGTRPTFSSTRGRASRTSHQTSNKSGNESQYLCFFDGLVTACLVYIYDTFSTKIEPYTEENKAFKKLNFKNLIFDVLMLKNIIMLDQLDVRSIRQEHS